jgi:hypothetical protein
MELPTARFLNTLLAQKFPSGRAAVSNALKTTRSTYLASQGELDGDF